jgi:hypothetical protein
MVFEARNLRDDRLHGVDTAITGGVTGSGRWGVRPVDGGTLVHFDWIVQPRALWMRGLSPFTRPVFIWNHRELMVEGGEALARRLDTRLLSRPACTPSVSSAVPEATLALAGLALITTLLVRRVSGAHIGPRSPGPEIRL